jgi:hypothetical protein
VRVFTVEAGVDALATVLFLLENSGLINVVMSPWLKEKGKRILLSLLLCRRIVISSNQSHHAHACSAPLQVPKQRVVT